MEKNPKHIPARNRLKALGLGRRRTVDLAETCGCEYARELSDEGTAIAH